MIFMCAFGYNFLGEREVKNGSSDNINSFPTPPNHTMYSRLWYAQYFGDHVLRVALLISVEYVCISCFDVITAINFVSFENNKFFNKQYLYVYFWNTEILKDKKEHREKEYPMKYTRWQDFLS